MPQRPIGSAASGRAANGRPALVVAILATALVLAAANVALLILTVRHVTGDTQAPLLSLSTLYLPGLIYFAAAPLVAALLPLAIALRRGSASPPALETAAPGPPAPPSPAAALRLLGLLQQEARLVDFIEEDIEPYSDEQVGAAVRSIHVAARKVLHEHLRLERILASEDGSEIEIGKDFDPATVRLTGNVTGQPPFRGTVQHGGWRASKVALPEGNTDPTIIAPAEVEIP